jgi:hypothetical protein
MPTPHERVVVTASINRFANMFTNLVELCAPWIKDRSSKCEILGSIGIASTTKHKISDTYSIYHILDINQGY